MLCVGSIVFFANPLTGCGDVNINHPDSEADPDPVEDPATWRFPQSITDNISPDSTEAQSPDTAMDSSGNMIVVWQQDDGVSSQIYKSEFRNGVWTHPSSLADNISPDGESATYPQVAMDDDGNAIIVWTQSSGTDELIFKSEYRNGSWTHPSSIADHISPVGDNGTNPQVAMDNNGNAIIVWEEMDGGGVYQIYKSEYRSGSWTHPSGLADNISPDAQSANNPKVAMDNNGNAIIAWSQSDGAFKQIFKSEYRSGSWTHPSGLADNISFNGTLASEVDLAMSDNGDAVIVWSQRDGSAKTQIFKSERRSGSWTHPSSLADNISPDTKHATMPSVAIDNSGNTIIVWAQQDTNSDQQTYKSEYRSGSWTHPSSLADHISPAGGQGTNNWPYVSMNKAGTIAVIAWDQDDGTNTRIYKSVYEDGAWTHPTSLTDAISPAGSNASMNVGLPVLVNGDKAMITWQQSDGTNYQIFKAEYR